MEAKLFSLEKESNLPHNEGKAV